MPQLAAPSGAQPADRFWPGASHRAHIEAIAQGFQGGGDAVDAGGVLDVGEAVDLLGWSLIAAPIPRGERVLDHLVEEKNFMSDTSRQDIPETRGIYRNSLRSR